MSGIPSTLCGGRFKVDTGRPIGEGCFGAVYRGTDKTLNRKVAIKFEFRDCAAPGSLSNEDSLLRKLAKPVQQQGFVEAFWFGHPSGNSCMVMELLGKSVEDLVEVCDGQLEVKTVVLVAIQALQRIEYLHSKGMVHRDIKPENFMWGIDDKVHHLYLIDFGMSTKYWEKEHLKEKKESSLVGTARYASINAHELRTQSRRDDLEAIGHMLFYLLLGVLPWSGLKARTDSEKYRMIGEKKKKTPLEDLCKGHPREFATYLAYCRALPWAERPDYERLQQMFQKVRNEVGPVEDHQLQWLEGDENVDPDALTPIWPWTSITIPQPDDLSSCDTKVSTKRWLVSKVSLGRSGTMQGLPSTPAGVTSSSATRCASDPHKDTE